MNFWERNNRLGGKVMGILLSAVMVTGIVLPVFADDDTSVLDFSDIMQKIDTNALETTVEGLSDAEVQFLRDILLQIDSGTLDEAELDDILGDIDVQVLRDILQQIDSAASEKAEAEADTGTDAGAQSEPESQKAEESPKQDAAEQPASETPVADASNTPTEAPAESTAAPVENTPAPETSTPAPVESTPAPVKTITAPEEITQPIEPEEDVEEEPVLDYPDGITINGSDKDITLSDAEIQEVLDTLPEGLSAERVGVVLNAYSLVNKVNYFWGGKSYTQGWDERWGNTAYVSSGGSSSSGTYRPYGLDCSGYVAWAFCNASGYTISGQLGIGTRYQWKQSQETAWEDAQPGDLAFFYDPELSGSINHIGIVVGWDVDGELLIAHCSSSKNTVAVTRAKATGFKYIRTPDIYSNESFVADSYSYKGLGTYLLWQSTVGIEVDDIEAYMEIEDTEPTLTIEDIEIGDLIFSEIPSWGAEAKVGIVTGYDKDDNLLVSYPTEEVDDTGAAESADVIGSTAAADGVVSAEDAESAEGEDESVPENEIVSVPIDQVDNTNVRRIESSGALSYLKGELPVYKMKNIYGGKELAEKAKEPYEMEASEDHIELD